MTKPTFPDFSSSTQGWDALVSQVISVLRAPVPLSEQTSLANLNSAFPAGNYDRCLAAVNIPASGNWGGGYLPAFTGGTGAAAWKFMGLQAADVGAASFANVAAAQTWANALRQNLQAAGVMAP